MSTLNRFSRWLAEHSNSKTIIAITIFFVMVLVIMETSPIGTRELKAASGGQGMLDMRFGYSEVTISKMFDALGTHGRILYERLLALDAVFAFVFMALESTVMSVLIRRSDVPEFLMRLNLLPVLRSALDLSENVLLGVMLARYPNGLTGLAPIASSVTRAKWFVYYAVIISILFFGVLSLRRLKEQSK